MSDIARLTKQGVADSPRKGFWVHAGDLNQKIEQGQLRETALQQRLTAADELNDTTKAELAWQESDNAELRKRVDVLEGLLLSARQYHGVTLLTDPPQDAWKHHRISERIDAELSAKSR